MPPAEKRAARLLRDGSAKFSDGGRVYFTSGGSEATENRNKTGAPISPGERPEGSLPYPFTAAELSPAAHLERCPSVGIVDPPRAVRTDHRRMGTHRSVFLLPTVPYEKTFPQCGLACADDLHTQLDDSQKADAAPSSSNQSSVQRLGASGAGLKATPLRIAEICRKNGILLIADEVMS